MPKPRIDRSVSADESRPESSGGDWVDLFEYQGKQCFARYGMPVSDGEVAFTTDEAVAAAKRLGTPVMVKALSLIHI